MPARPRAPLDPDSAALLALLSSLKLPPYESMAAPAARELAALLVRNARMPKVSVGAVEDVTIDAEGHRVPVRHYRPFAEGGESGLAALIYFHGGGWVLGDLDSHDHLCRSLTRNAGIAVLSVAYPLAPENPFPKPLDVAAGVVGKIFSQAGDLGLDTRRIGIGGDSAGGNIAAALALMAREGGLPAPRVQCLIYPALDLTLAHVPNDMNPDNLLLPRETLDWFIENYTPDPASRRDWRASPLLASSVAGVAPAYVLTAGHDVLAAEAMAYVERLRQAGVAVTHRDFPGQLHNFVALPHALPTALLAISDLAEYLVQELRGLSGA